MASLGVSPQRTSNPHLRCEAEVQDTLFPRFMLYRLRLQLALGVGRQRLPAYLGSTVRGLFAASFRHLVCVTQASVCDGCLLLHRCPYLYVFEGFDHRIGHYFLLGLAHCPSRRPERSRGYVNCR